MDTVGHQRLRTRPKSPFEQPSRINKQSDASP
jgi:hypothetical protein